MEVLDTKHKFGDTGKYFGFERTAIPNLKPGESKVFVASNSRTGEIGEVIVWGIESGDATAHGRFKKDFKNSQWRKGDGLIIYVDVNVNSLHRFTIGRIGKPKPRSGTVLG